MAFQTTSDLLSEIASDYLSNEDDLSGAGRKIELKDNLVVEFNNKASEVNPALRVLVLGQLLVIIILTLKFTILLPISAIWASS